MTALNNNCDVCGRSPMIGVCSTSIPYSCAFCAECAERGADPSWVLSYFIDDVACGDLNNLHPQAVASLNTWHDGRYVGIEEWMRIRPPPDQPQGEIVR